MALINKLEAIGDAIRSKTGETAEMTLEEMATAIANLSTGTEEEITNRLGNLYLWVDDAQNMENEHIYLHTETFDLTTANKLEFRYALESVAKETDLHSDEVAPKIQANLKLLYNPTYTSGSIAKPTYDSFKSITSTGTVQNRNIDSSITVDLSTINKTLYKTACMQLDIVLYNTQITQWGAVGAKVYNIKLS